ncbi:MAG: hypothetical protein ABIO44_04940 [Saprospiraceae bacterium]
MTRYQALTVYATLIIVTGLILMLLSIYPTRLIQYVVAFGMLSSAFFAFYTAYKSHDMQIPLHYHALHAIGMVVYGFAILFFANDIQRFFNITIFFLTFYGMAEMIFCFQLLMLRQKFISARIIGFRLLIGFFITTGAIFILATSFSDKKIALLASGAVFVFSGVFLIVFKSVLKKADKPILTDSRV